MAVIEVSRENSYTISLKFSLLKCAVCEHELEMLDGNEVEAGKVLVIRPDFNSAGVLTHYHAEVLDDPADSPNNNAKDVAERREQYRVRNEQMELNRLAILRQKEISGENEAGLEALFGTDEARGHRTRSEIVADKMEKKKKG